MSKSFPQLRTPTPREIRLAMAVMGVSAAALFYVYIAEPRTLAWIDLETAISEARAEYEERSILVLHEDEIRTRFERIGQQGAKGGAATADTIEFYQFLSDLDTGDTLRIRDIRPVAAASEERGSPVNKAVVFCEGGMDGLEKFLGGIARASEAIQVEKLALTVSASGSPAKITATVAKRGRSVP